MNIRSLLPLFALLFLPGCASYKVRKLDPVPPMAQASVLPRIQAFPVVGQVSDVSKRLVTGEPNPVWQPTVIAKVRYDAYVDENNIAWEPSTGYVIMQQGGWNLEAIRKGNTYVPPANSIKPMNLPGVAYGSATVGRAPSQAEALPLYDIDSGKVLYTNLIRPEDEAQARAMAGEGNVAVFDPRLGWVIVPQAVARSAVELTGRMPEAPAAPRRDGPVQVAPPSQLSPPINPQGSKEPPKFRDL